MQEKKHTQLNLNPRTCEQILFQYLHVCFSHLSNMYERHLWKINQKFLKQKIKSWKMISLCAYELREEEKMQISQRLNFPKSGCTNLREVCFNFPTRTKGMYKQGIKNDYYFLSLVVPLSLRRS